MYNVSTNGLHPLPTLLMVTVNDTTGDCAAAQTLMTMGDDVNACAGAFSTHAGEGEDVGDLEDVGDADRGCC